MEEYIYNSLEIACVDEEAYLNKLVAYQLQFEGYTYDKITNKLVEVHVIVSHKFSHVQAAIIATSFRNEHVVTTTKEPKPFNGGVELVIVTCTLFLPIEFVETLVVVVSTQVRELEELVFPKPIPLVILEVGVGAEVTLIGIVTHAYEVFRTPNKY